MTTTASLSADTDTQPTDTDSRWQGTTAIGTALRLARYLPREYKYSATSGSNSITIRLHCRRITEFRVSYLVHPLQILVTLPYDSSLTTPSVIIVVSLCMPKPENRQYTPSFLMFGLRLILLNSLFFPTCSKYVCQSRKIGNRCRVF